MSDDMNEALKDSGIIAGLNENKTSTSENCVDGVGPHLTDVTRDKRDYGMDLLKIVSMFMVVLLHSFSLGALKGAAPLTAHYEMGFFVESLVFCCVNCFALASGYIGTAVKFKYRRIVSLWLQVVFYTLTMTVLFVYIAPNLSPNSIVPEHPILTALTPVMSNSYWYFTSYFALFFFMPFINLAMRDISVRQAWALIASVIMIYIVIPYFAKADLFVIGSGYNATWLMLMYAVGGALRKCNEKRIIKNKYCYLALYFIFAVMAWSAKFIKEYGTQQAGEFKADAVFLQYTSIFIFLSSIFLLLFFANVKVKRNKAKKLIRLIAPATFSVYLIHTNPYVFYMPFWDKLTALREKPAAIMVGGGY